jgi:predicted dehydrogenase
LKALGYNNFTVWDVTDKTAIDEVVQTYEPDCMIVSSPPKTKGKYIALASKLGIPVFCEADIVSYTEGTYCPSCSLIYHPGIQKIHELLDNKALGKLYTFTYHQGMHLRDWRPAGFNFKGYYAAELGAKEMFCFELSWLSYLFGTPENCAGFVDKKLNDPDISADDIYAASVKFNKQTFQTDNIGDINGVSFIRGHAFQESIVGTVLIDILSRPATRSLVIIGSEGAIKWNWNDSFISIETADGLKETHGYDKGKAAPGYNENIPELMYENELANWILAIQGKEQYLFSKEDEKAVMNMLEKIEGSIKND